MCNKAVENYAQSFEFVPDCYKTQELCNKAINTSSAIQFVLACYKAQEIIDKIVCICSFVLDSVTD